MTAWQVSFGLFNDQPPVVSTWPTREAAMEAVDLAMMALLAMGKSLFVADAGHEAWSIVNGDGTWIGSIDLKQAVAS